ncbi:DUF4394 domain-containing protein [Hymenobacter properus]|uniref:DUF4394 domain-containing protein n=1 Tax=Hymenobacter properus TaxID=2791026 RepID=A0A931FKB1_9BACT|nr:DUF4394 domain-containing protein [Hymenobacter properus]MBF9142843.1 DUF4394 domain-containing protein [Hymenobacter properus]MBR7721652.1 DUF4394 domain-containing protein [Microvirga sp. SRT04]
MSKHLLSPLAARQRLRRLTGAAALGAGLLLGAASGAQAQTVYGLGTATTSAIVPAGSQGLITINLTTGFTNTLAPSPITYTSATDNLPLVGLDFRPANGLLYALGYDGTGMAQLYTVDPSNGLTTPVAPKFPLALGTNPVRIGFDFNPSVDRIRVVSSTGADFRLNPITGGLAATDTNLAYAASDVNVGKTPRVGAAAYTNSVTGTAPLNTQLYDIDEQNNDAQIGYLTTQSPPNNGTLNTVGELRLGSFGIGAARGFDLDIYFNPTTGQNVGYLEEVNGSGGSNFYTLDLSTGQATSVGNTVPAAAGFEIRDIAAQPSTTAPSTTGQLLYAVSGGQLVSFYSDTPSLLRTSVLLGPLNAGESLVGLDFRPLTGELFALGYNPTNSNARLYTVNLSTGAVTPVGSGPISLALGTASDRIGFDFNPTVDRIRVVSTNRADYRLNPATGGLAATDGTLTTGPVISAAAYINNQAPTNATTLYDYDATNSNLYIQNPPNNGTLVLVGSSGLTPPTAPRGADFDIFNTPNTTTNAAYLLTNAGASVDDQLYTLDLTTGAATPKGIVGYGGDVSGLAAFISAGSLLTWTGAVSTAWSTAGNWTPAQVPTSSSDVVIGAAANQPVVSNAQQARTVTLNSGAILTTANGGTLTVVGNFTNAAGTVAGAGTGTVALNGAAQQTIAGPALSTFTNLSVLGTPGATTTGPVAIQRGLTVAGPLAIGTGQAFTLLSSASGTAYVVNTGSGTVTGTATVQRYIDPSLNAGLGYRHYSAPVSNTTVADLQTSGFTPVVNSNYNTVGNTVTPFPNVFGYDETRVNTSGSGGSIDFDKGYFSPGALNDPMQVSRGYTVNISASQLVDFVGTLNNGATPIVASGLTRGPQAESGYHLRGNPFPSVLDWNLMVVNNRLNGVNNALYVFKSSGQYTGSYASYISGFGTNGGTNSVPLGQGFFVRTTAAGTPGSLTFTNQERTTTFDATPFQRNAADTRPQLTLALGNATARTQAIVYMEAGATAGYDRAFDANFLPGSNGLTLALEAGAERLAIDGLPALTGADVIVPLQLAAATSGTHTLQVDDLANLPAGYSAYLRDGLSGTYTRLTPGTSIPLTLAANTAAGGRYAVEFTTQARVLATAPAALAKLATVHPNPAHGAATLLLPVALRGQQATNVSVVDNLGRTVLTRTLAAGTAETLELPLAGLAPGVYSVLARTAAGLVAKRLVVE